MLDHAYCSLYIIILGYVDREAIELMVVPDSVKEIEDFISDNFPGDKAYFGQMSKPVFKFLPAHAAKLKSFISKIKDDMSAKMLKRTADLPKGIEKRKCQPSSKPEILLNFDPADIYAAVRQQIVKWICGQPNLNLKENDDYEIIVSPALSTSEYNHIVMVQCLCCLKKPKTRLFQRGSGFMLSNWTKHVLKHCAKDGKRKDNFKQQPLLLTAITSQNKRYSSIYSYFVGYIFNVHLIIS